MYYVQVDLDTSTRPLLVTPNRFTRMTQIAFWNTGNGSPDAVAFSVDRPGIVLAGVCVYGGSGTYEYEVELLVEVCGEVSPCKRSEVWLEVWGGEGLGEGDSYLRMFYFGCVGTCTASRF